MAPMSPPPWTLFCPRSGLRPGAVAPDMPGEQRQVDQRADVVGAVVVLGDAEGPAQLGALGACVGVRELRIASAGTPVTFSATSRVQGSTDAAYSSKPRGGALDERRVVRAGVDDLAADRVRQRDVRADVQAEPAVRPLAR